jgi:Flp pilus assembly secretin CpaC
LICRGTLKEVLVADTKTVNVVVRTMRRVYIVGAVLGDTNVFFYDNDGQQIAALDVCVSEYHRPRNDKSGIGSDKETIATLYESDGFVP